MTGSINKAQILGRLGQDPQIIMTQSGKEIAKFNIATSERFTDKNGEIQERTEWHRVVIFADGLVSKVVKPYLKTGSRVFVEGSNRTEKYTDKDGIDRYSTEVVVRELILVDRKQS